MSFDVALRNPGTGFDVALVDAAPPAAAKVFLGSTALTIPGFTKAYVGSVLIYPSGVSYEAEASALFARMTAEPDATRKGHINTLIAALKVAGIWAKLDVLYLFAAHDSQAALLNWKSTNFTPTLVGPNTPAHNADIGFSGATSASNTANNIETGYNPNVGGLNYTGTSSHFGIFTTKIATFNYIMTFFPGFLSALIRAESRVFGRSGFNPDTDILTGSVSQRGHYAMTRSGAVDTGVYNGSFNGSPTTADTENRGPARLLTGGGLDGHRMAAFHAGAYLDSTEFAAFYSALNTYVTALGSPPPPPPAPVYQSQANYAGFSTSVDKPSGTVEGDFLIGFFAGSDIVEAITVPSGWTQVGGTVNVNSGGQIVVGAIAYKFAGASEPASYSFSAPNWHAAVVMRITGVDPTTPVADYGSVGKANGVTSTTTPALTATDDNNMLVVCGFGFEGTTPNSTPSGMTERANWSGENVAWTQEIASAGAVGGASFTTNATNVILTLGVVLNPAPV